MLCWPLWCIAPPILQWPDPNLSQERAAQIVVVLDNSLSMDQRPSDANEGTGASEALLSKAKEELCLLIQSFQSSLKLQLLRGVIRTIRTSGFEDKQSTLLAILSEIFKVTQDRFGRKHSSCSAALAGEGGEIFVYTDEAGPFLRPSAHKSSGVGCRAKAAPLPRWFV